MFILAIVTLAGLSAAGFLFEIHSARASTCAALRRRLNQVYSGLWSLPSRAVRWHHEHRERSYQPAGPSERSVLAVWSIRAHLIVVVPLASLVGASVFESLAEQHKPIAGLYLSPDQAWYFGALAGFLFGAIAPLVAYVVFWILVVLPFAVTSIAVGVVRRQLIEATDGATGRDQAPFAITGLVLGLLAGGVVLVLGG